MKAATRLFGEIEIDESKIIHILVTVHGRAGDSISGNGSAVRL